jgi:dihydrodipicolinate synthase/N-acetylneuraminate lyase
MFNYTATILTHFFGIVSSAKVYSINSFRIDVEDYAYIVETQDCDYILYETDYMFDTDEAVDVLKTITVENNYIYVKLLSPDTFGKDARILRIEGNARIYLAAEIKANGRQARINPVDYGGGAAIG